MPKTFHIDQASGDRIAAVVADDPLGLARWCPEV
jgi:hypothetical protein